MNDDDDDDGVLPWQMVNFMVCFHVVFMMKNDDTWFFFQILVLNFWDLNMNHWDIPSKKPSEMSTSCPHGALIPIEIPVISH